jgi:MFS family permease
MAELLLDKSRRRTARLAIAVFFFVSGFGFSTWASRIPNIQQHLRLNEAELGWVLFALPAGLMVTLPFTGMLLSRYNGRYVMLAGAIVFNVMLTMIGLVSSTWQLMLILFFFGCSRNLFNISLNAQSIAVQKMYDRSIIASFHGIWSLAGFGGAALGALMVAMNQQPLLHFFVVAIILTSLLLYFFQYTPDQQPAAHERQPLFVVPGKALVKYGVISFASMACEGTMFDWSGIYFKKVVGAPKDLVTVGFALYMVAMTLGRLTGDRVVGFLGIQQVLKYSGVLIFTGLITAVAFPFYLPACVGFIMVGFGVSCVIPLVFSLAGKSKTMGSGPAIAAVSSIGYLGFLLIPPIVGFIAQTSNLRWSFLMIAFMGLIITWIVSVKKV